MRQKTIKRYSLVLHQLIFTIRIETIKTKIVWNFKLSTKLVALLSISNKL